MDLFSLMDVFLKFAHDPDVQSVFTSITTDPDVFLAVMNNHKLKEFFGSQKNDIIINNLLHMLGNWIKKLGNHGNIINGNVKTQILMMANNLSNYVDKFGTDESATFKVKSDKSSSFKGKSYDSDSFNGRSDDSDSLNGKSDDCGNNDGWLAWLGNLVKKLGNWVKELGNRVIALAKNVMDRVVEMVCDLSKYVYNIVKTVVGK